MALGKARFRKISSEYAPMIAAAAKVFKEATPSGTGEDMASLYRLVLRVVRESRKVEKYGRLEIPNRGGPRQSHMSMIGFAQFSARAGILTYGIRSASALTVRSFLKIFHRLSIHGKEHLPKDQSFMMVANHSSHLDVLCMLAALPFNKLHRAFPAAAADYFFVNIPRTAIAAMVVNAFPFQRQKCSRGSLRICEELLSTPGNILILFPEGTRDQ